MRLQFLKLSYLFLIVFWTILFLSCNNSKKEEKEPEKNNTIDKKEEIPVIFRSGEANGNRFFVNREGDTLFNGRTFYNTYEFKNGYCVVKEKINDTVKSGVINYKGEVVVPIKFTEMLYGYEDGGYFKMYKKGSGTGYIDSTGKVVIPPVYGTSKGVKDGLVKLKSKVRPVKWGMLSTAGDTIIPFEYDNIGIWRDDLAWVQDKNKGYGFVDKSGKRVIDFQYDYVKSFEDGIALVKKDDKIGFIDTQNNPITEFIYEDVKEIADVSEDDLNLDGSGFKQTNKRFTTNAGYIIVKKDGHWGYIDTKGEIAIPFEYDWVDVPEGSGDLARVGKDGKSGYFDIKDQDVRWSE